MEPNLGSKTLHFLTNRHRETSNPPKTSQDPQNLLQNPSRTPPRLLQASPKRVQSITFRPHLAKSVSFSQILAQQHNKSTFEILTGPNTQYAFHFSLLYIRGTLVSVLARWRISLWLTGYVKILIRICKHITSARINMYIHGTCSLTKNI